MSITQFKEDHLNDGSVTTSKIADKNVTSAKLEDNINIVGTLSLGNSGLKISNTTNYASFTTGAGAAKAIAIHKLLVSNAYADWSIVPSDDGSAYFKGSVIINGALEVRGATTTINTNQLNISDNLITLNSDVTGAPSENAGMEIQRGTSSNVSVLWNETNDYWTLTNNGINWYRIVDENYGDGRYAKLGGSTLSGDITFPITVSASSKGIVWSGLTDTHKIFVEEYGGAQSSRLVIQSADDGDSDYTVFRNNTVDILSVKNTIIQTHKNLQVLGGLQIGTSSTAGYVLTTNASGVGSWAALPADKYLSSVSGNGNATNVTFTIANGTNVTWNASHSHASDHAPGSDNQNVFTKLHALNSSGVDVTNSPYTAASQTDAIKLKSGSNVTLSMSGDTITINSSYTDTNTATAADNILKGSNSGTQITYAPYTTNEAANLRFYTAANDPTGTSRLNLGGYLYATKLYSGAKEVLTTSTAYFSKVSAQNSSGTVIGTASATVNDDTFTLKAGTGISLSVSGKVITIDAGSTNTVTTVTQGSIIQVTDAGTNGNYAYTVAHKAINAPTEASGSGRKYITGVTTDGYGHITGFTTASETVVDTNTTYSAGNGITLTGTAFSAKLGTGLQFGAEAEGSKTIQVAYGTTSTTACAGNDSRLSNARTPATHGDDKHDCYMYARISFAKGQSRAVWTHNKNWANYIIQMTPNSPETHYYYDSKTNNSVAICLDDEAYDPLDVDVVLINANAIATSGFTMS